MRKTIESAIIKYCLTNKYGAEHVGEKNNAIFFDLDKENYESMTIAAVYKEVVSRNDRVGVTRAILRKGNIKAHGTITRSNLWYQFRGHFSVHSRYTDKFEIEGGSEAIGLIFTLINDIE